MLRISDYSDKSDILSFGYPTIRISRITGSFGYPTFSDKSDKIIRIRNRIILIICTKIFKNFRFLFDFDMNLTTQEKFILPNRIVGYPTVRISDYPDKSDILIFGYPTIPIRRIIQGIGYPTIRISRII